MKARHILFGFALVFAAYGLLGCSVPIGVEESQSAVHQGGQPTALSIFPTSSNQRFLPPGGDWAPGWAKTTCGGFGSEIAVGISGANNGANHLLICSNSGWTAGVGGTIWQPGASSFIRLDVRSRNDDRNSYAITRFGDWAPGSYKASCPLQYIVAAIATDPNNSQGMGFVGCIGPITGFNGDNLWAETLEYIEPHAFYQGDWDYGYTKGMCANGRFVVGMAHTAGWGSRVTTVLCSGDPFLP